MFYENVAIFDIVKESASLDNESSLFVTHKNGINFAEESGITNGHRIYMVASSKNDKYPLYYYRGNVENNNVIFANSCWKIVRTTETGGTKLIYSGPVKDGKCDNVGKDTQLTSRIKYDSSYSRMSSASYSYSSIHSFKYTTLSKITNGMIFANDVSYENGKYILKDKYIKDENFE